MQYKISQRRAGRVIGRSRSTLRYDRKYRSDEPPLVREIKRLARRHPRFGYRRVHVMLGRKGWSVNLTRSPSALDRVGAETTVEAEKPGKLPVPLRRGYSCVRKPARFKKSGVWTCGFIRDRTVPRRFAQVVDVGGRIYSGVPGSAGGRINDGSRGAADRGSGWSVVAVADQDSGVTEELRSSVRVHQQRADASGSHDGPHVRSPTEML